MFLKSPVKDTFRVRPENCKKKKKKKKGGGGEGVYLTFHPEISNKKGVFFSLSIFGLLRNLKRGL